MKPQLSLIVAMTQSRVIGVQNRLPWHIPEDLKRFKKLTHGHPVIMGRKTFESIGRPLPGRTNIVVTRSKEYRSQGIVVAHSLAEAISFGENSPGANEIFVIGGAELFRESLPEAQRIYLTEIQWPYEGDTFFPLFSRDDFVEVSKETLSEDPAAILHLLERKSADRPWAKT
jgi:dihydrofolate reductase